MNERIRIGDRVQVNHQTGRVVDVVRQPNRYQADPRGEYRVKLDNGVGPIFTRNAVKIEEPTPELPVRNIQAATFAHNLLGPDADLDKLIGVAEFAMDRRTLGTETTGTVPLLDGIVTEIPATSAAPEDKLTITDKDGDRVEFAAREWDNPNGVNVTVYEDGDRATAYLTKDDLARVVAFLDGHRRTFTASA